MNIFIGTYIVSVVFVLLVGSYILYRGGAALYTMSSFTRFVFVSCIPVLNTYIAMCFVVEWLYKCVGFRRS